MFTIYLQKKFHEIKVKEKQKNKHTRQTKKPKATANKQTKQLW